MHERTARGRQRVLGTVPDRRPAAELREGETDGE
jgi:hypothetical protein